MYGLGLANYVENSYQRDLVPGSFGYEHGSIGPLEDAEFGLYSGHESPKYVCGDDRIAFFVDTRKAASSHARCSRGRPMRPKG